MGYGGARGIYYWSFNNQGIECPSAAATDFIRTATEEWFEEPIPFDRSAFARGRHLAGLFRGKRSLLLLDGLETLQKPLGHERPGHIEDEGLREFLATLALPATTPFLCVITTRVPVTDLDLWCGKTVRYLDLQPLPDRVGVELLRGLGVRGEDAELFAAVTEWKNHPLSLTWLATQLVRQYRGDIEKRSEITGNTTDYKIDRLFSSYDKCLPAEARAFLCLLAFFNGPAHWPEIFSLIEKPALPDLTEAFTDRPQSWWDELLHTLQECRLVTTHSPGTQAEETIDFYHPIARNYYRRVLFERADTWQEGSRRLFHFYRGGEEIPSIEREFEPLRRAVWHACSAGEQLAAFRDIIWGKFWQGWVGFQPHGIGLGRDDEQMMRLFFPNALGKDPHSGIMNTFPAQDLARLHHWAGVVAQAAGMPTEAILRNTQAAALFAEVGDYVGAGFASGYLAMHHLIAGSLREAIRSSEKCLRLVEEHLPHLPTVRILALGVSARVFHAAGRWDESGKAFDFMHRLLKQVGRAGYPGIEALNEAHYCIYLVDRHEFLGESLARDRIENGVEGIHYPGPGRSLARLTLGRFFLLAGDLPRAIPLIESSAEELVQSAVTDLAIRGLLGRARLDQVRGQTETAHKDTETALNLSEKRKHRLCEIECHLELVALNLAVGPRSAASVHWDIAARLIRQCGYQRAEKRREQLRRQIEIV
ncbi:hypothetical protein [Fimbriiglobus ruber]|uniref:WD-40 repeat protein n=1 Tax=Fimbriiglobus ruber TaxID=1908690 RepID=A0A225E8S3_9BACT|nr:hypothetical protein [Fimbriiglobus ruber]OWK46476.1 WD-40 repeat protein [Fimbriiglobus ruber]